MRRYAASGVTAANVGTIDHAIAGLWNPSGLPGRIGLVRVEVLKTGTGGSPQAVHLRRTTTEGTPGTTITPTIVSDVNRDLAPPSAARLGLSAYTVQPTLESLNLNAIWAIDGIASGFALAFDDSPLWIDPGAGIVLTVATGSIHGAARVTLEWLE